MDFDLFREMKKHAIVRMQLNLPNVERSDLPHWQIDLLARVILAGMLIYNAGSIVLGVGKSILISFAILVLTVVIAPFMAVYVWFDLMLVTNWYVKQIVQRMKGEI